MTEAQFYLSAFGDEIADDLGEQLALLRQLAVGHLELRGVWGKNVLHLTDEEVARLKQECDQQQIGISSIGSPIGKSPLADPIDREVANLHRICQIAEALGTRRIRVFSFYPDDTSTNTHYDQYVEDVVARLARLTEVAAAEGMELLLENEKGIVGDTVARCHALLKGVNSPHLRFVWDPANFVQVGEERVTERGWPLLGDYVAHVHVKDAVLGDGGVRAAGEGDGQVDLLLEKLRDSGYRGFLGLEPHLAIAGHSSGFSGVSGMTYAVETLRRLMERLGCLEVKPDWAVS